MDWLSPSDPILYLYEKPTGGGDPILLGNTERIQNCADPQWISSIDVSVAPGTKSKLLVLRVWSADQDAEDAQRQTHFIGFAEFDMCEWVSQKQPGPLERGLLREAIRPGTSPQFTGHVEVLRWEKRPDQDEILMIRMSVAIPKGIFKPNLFVRVSRYCGTGAANTANAGAWRRCYQSEVQGWKMPNTRFTQAGLSVQLLCNYSATQPILFELFEKKLTGDSKIGALVTTKTELLDPQRPAALCFLGTTAQLFLQAKAEPLAAGFEEHVRTGTSIELSIAINVTMDQPEMTTRALRQFGNIFSALDSDQKIPVYGFGVTHTSFFNMASVTDYNATVSGVSSMIEVFESNLRKRQPGPVILSPLVQHVAQRAAADAKTAKSTYHLLVVFLNGVIDDSDQQPLVDAIVKASSSPMSVFLVGIGNNSHTSIMNRLDSDGSLLKSSTGAFAQRDIVKFVEFSGDDLTPLHTQATAEVRVQFMQYMLQTKGAR
eukprot:TRINITY_DN5554_c0_g1_i3.p1 TRINITY_DN5554_c0_g1~~TRINITY_DN5554_c0_g1_i3.p1  ORF type:complete len:509 (-),score=122.29 TRINITY_DN5554_c0_g1_i3:98-1561(-)